MKLFVLILSIALFSCGSSDSAEDAQKIIDYEKSKLYMDSVSSARQLEYETAQIEYEKATGKKDTLTKAERLKRAKESFRQQ